MLSRYSHHGSCLRREYYNCHVDWSSSPVVDLTFERSVSGLPVVPFEYTTEDQRLELLSSALAFCKFLKPCLVTWDRGRYADDVVPLPKDAVPVASVDQSLFLETHPLDESASQWVAVLPYATGELGQGFIRFFPLLQFQTINCYWPTYLGFEHGNSPHKYGKLLFLFPWIVCGLLDRQPPLKACWGKSHGSKRHRIHTLSL